MCFWKANAFQPLVQFTLMFEYAHCKTRIRLEQSKQKKEKKKDEEEFL
jgi:hypothetical protein